MVTKTIKVLIADDHDLIRTGIKHVLEESGDIKVSAQATDGGSAIQLARSAPWDVAILDFNMPNRNGIEALRILCDEWPKRPVLMLSMYPEEQYAVRAIKAGAAGYIPKQNAATAIVEAVRRVANGGKFITPIVAELLATAMSNKQPISVDLLSNRELQVLSLIAQGKPLTQIGDALNLSVKTVSQYRRRILDKLGFDSTGELIRFGVENGLID